MQTVSGSRQAVHFAVTIRKNELIHVAKNDKIKNSFYVVKKGGKLHNKEEGRIDLNILSLEHLTHSYTGKKTF